MIRRWVGVQRGLSGLVEQLSALDRRVAALDRDIARRAKEDTVARRLMTIPGIGAVTAVALVSLAPPAESFRRGRDFAASDDGSGRSLPCDPRGGVFC
jgi:transposase